jgi:hypothetical protein
MRERLAIVLFGTLALLTSCGRPEAETPTTIDPVALPRTVSSRCESLLLGRLAGDQVTLVAAYESTGTEIALWMESGRVPGGGRAGPGQVLTRSLPAGETIASCYFDGTFTFRGPVPKGAVPPRPERMLFLIDPAGVVLAEMGGTRQLYPLVRPAP